MISIQNATPETIRAIAIDLSNPPSISLATTFCLADSLCQTKNVLQSIVHQMTIIFVTIDDFLKEQPIWRNWRRSPNNTPRFTDAEVLTVALMQGCLKVATLKHAYQIIATDFATAFPLLPSYCQFMARVHALQALQDFAAKSRVGRLIQQVIPILQDNIYLMDSKPIPVCKPIRHGRVRLLREEGAYFGKNSCGWYFGFKLHTIIHRTGTVLCAFLTPANISDSDLALALAQSVDGGILLADKAYQTQEIETQLLTQAELVLITPKNCGKQHKALISSLRERIETTFSQLHERFVDRVRSRSFNGLWSTVKLKILHLNFCQAGLLTN